MKSHSIDLPPFVPGFLLHKVTSNVNDQHEWFSETLDLRFLDPLVLKLGSTTFFDINYGYDSAVGKAFAGFRSFLSNNHVDWGVLMEASVQTDARGTELNTLKLAVERDVVMR